MAISLDNLKSGPDKRPPRILMHGTQGVGKTTFAADAPNPVFIQTEDGLGLMDRPTFGLLKTFDEVMQALGALYSEDHQFDTLVVDSADWLEPLVQAETCRRHNWSSIEAPGYGKGYVEAVNVWREYVEGLNALRDDKGMVVIQLAHTDVKRFENPETEPYDRYIVKLHKNASALLMEHSDIVLFANYRVSVVETKDKKSTRAKGSGERRMYTSERPAFLAKNRYSLPDDLPLDWSALAEQLPNIPATSNNGKEAA
jgi:hypothetical protein